MSNRSPLLYLDDIIEAVEAVESYITADTKINDFIGDRKTYSATIREFIIIGEAINAIIQLLQEKQPNYPWRLLKDFRNIIVHEYFGIEPKIVFDAATIELKELKSIILKIKQEYN